MDDQFFGRIFSKIVLGIFLIILIDLFYINWWILSSQNQKVVQEKVVLVSPTPIAVSNPSSSPVPSPFAIPSGIVRVSDTKLESEAKQTVVGQQPVVVQTAEKEIFIPMGSGNSTSSTYADLHGVEVTIDTNKYPNISGIYFEAAISVEGGNGSAYAQIYNVNDNVSYVESQISNNTSTPTIKTSAKIPVIPGIKALRVRARNEFGQYKAYVDNARIKIILN